MVDLSGFRVAGRPQSRSQSYIKRIDGMAKLVIERKVAEEAVKYFGQDVNVLIDDETARIALARGVNRRISMAGANLPTVSLGNEEKLVKQWGRFTRIYLNASWESDQNHNKVLLFTPDGRVELEDDMTFKKVR